MDDIKNNAKLIAKFKMVKGIDRTFDIKFDYDSPYYVLLKDWILNICEDICREQEQNVDLDTDSSILVYINRQTNDIFYTYIEYIPNGYKIKKQKSIGNTGGIVMDKNNNKEFKNAYSEDLNSNVKIPIGNKDDNSEESNMMPIVDDGDTSITEMVNKKIANSLSSYKAHNVIIGIVIQKVIDGDYAPSDIRMIEHKFPIGDLFDDGYSSLKYDKTNPMTNYELAKRTCLGELLDNIAKFYESLGFSVLHKLIGFGE